jgi:two-component system, chemotaxis family, response regulator Rcp1
MTAASGSNPRQGTDRLFTLPFPENTAPQARLHILLVEGNKADVLLVREALKATGLPVDFYVVSDGETAIKYIDELNADETASCLSLILLDLNLPKKSGIEVLEHLRRTRKCENSPVVVVSSSDSIKDRAEAASMGADASFLKPSGYEACIRIGEIVKDLLLIEQPPGPWTPDAEPV